MESKQPPDTSDHTRGASGIVGGGGLTIQAPRIRGAKSACTALFCCPAAMGAAMDCIFLSSGTPSACLTFVSADKPYRDRM